MKRSRHPSSSEESDNGMTRRKKMKGNERETKAHTWTGMKEKKASNRREGKTAYNLRSSRKKSSDRRLVFRDILAGSSTCWSQHSKSQSRRGKGKKPSEVFRTDLITAMKVHDSHQLNTEDYYILADPWRQEWEKGVQVPVSPQSIPQPVARVLAEKGREVMFSKPKKLIRTSGSEALGYVDIRTLAEGMCRYDLNEEDVAWLQVINEEFAEMGMPALDELTMERVIEEFERCCHDNMTHAMETGEGLGIEYDEDVVCDVCQSPDGEDNNEMVFCDKCNICVHQACYGIQKVPKGSWLCRICALGILPKCQLCPKKGGAMKPTKSGTKWVHVSCALWIPEVSIGNPEKMEPITNVSHIPSNRWALICCICKEKTGACIQCSAKNCRTAFHVTCGLQASLEMNTILTEEDEVKFKSYCPKHSGLEGDESRDRDSGDEEEWGVRSKNGKRRGRVREEGGDTPAASFAPSSAVSAAAASSPPQLPAPATPGEPQAVSSQQLQQEEKRVNLRKMKLQELEEDFYQFVKAEEVSERLKLSQEAVDFVYQYWKLKRKANFNQPLLTPKKDEEESLARREQEVLLRRLQLFTHLRQDLERVRNLTYMVTRREKMKRILWRLQEQIFQHQVRLLDQELMTGEATSKDLADIFSLGRLSSHGSHSRSSWGHSSLKAKRSLKLEKRRSSHKKGALDPSHAPSKRDDCAKPLDTGDGAKDPAVVEPAGFVRTQNQDRDLGFHLSRLQAPPEVGQESASHVKLNKPDAKKGLKKEGAGPELRQGGGADDTTPLPPPPRRKREGDHDQEEKRRRKKRSGIRESSPVEVKNRLGPRHIVKTVSIRLRDIRHTDGFDYPADLGMPGKVYMAPVSSEAAATAAKPNGCLRKAHSTQANGALMPGGPAGSHLKTWGKFKIPKRSDRLPGAAKEQQQQHEQQQQQAVESPPAAAAASQQRKSLLRPLTNTPEPSSYPRTRLRTGTENAAYAPDGKAADGEVEPCMKRCHSHQLRGDATPLHRRYGSDIIRRGVLAS